MRVEALGDSGLLVDVEEASDDRAAARVAELRAAMGAEPLAGVTDVVPSYRTVGVHFDPALASRTRVRSWIEGCARTRARGVEARQREVVIPVCYGGAFGPDLEDVARTCKLGVDRVLALHTGGAYAVRAVGFVPGFAYMAGLHRKLHLPRRATPRLRVPAGSVAIAAGQAGVYPIESPGGWHLIGRTPLAMFRPGEAQVSLLQVGDRVRFEAISRERFDEMVGER